ncbi:hypothetical protein RRG08_018832, partial [Elysia crispata]
MSHLIWKSQVSGNIISIGNIQAGSSLNFRKKKPSMLRLLYLLGLTMTYLSGSDTRKVEILKPIRATGNEVGLIFPDGEFFKGENYKKTAEAIQAASELRVWVALNARYYRSFAGLYRTSRVPQEAIDALQNAGMTSQNFVGVAHGIE